MGVFRRFKTDQRGATAIIFGFVAIPLVALAGAAVDYSRASMAQTKIQVAIDQAALAIVKLPRTASQEVIDAIAKNAVESVFGFETGTRSPSGITLQPPTAERTGSAVTVRATGTSDSAFMQLLGIASTPIGASSQALWSTKRIEIALVLDNTGSMNDRESGKHKIEELINAAKEFVSEAKRKAVDNDSIKISIVPFDTEVRVDPDANRNATWFRFVDSSTVRANWTGYLIDRFGSYAGTDSPVTGEASKHPALKSTREGGSLPTITPLASVKTNSADMIARIEAMKPRGLTNIGLGVTWGLATLSASAPFSEASGERHVERYMIVFTDGDNTAYHKDGVLLSSLERGLSRAAKDKIVADMNTYTKLACDEAKKTASVYTIRLLKGDENLLRSCASTPSNYQDVQNPADLTSAFDRILRDILATRITS
ncbi:pilus assembly protein [Enterovirga rhinocerotis]|uniref:Putative Flp pilus-assembly TadE/G-like protein n=1 Tax=Enterovirga rhinocerotis TaxID=1339210 RepID=A0A4V3DXC9_9HYPH|nr:pilus assembly protein [Enterovirga rhinocerotis]TDR88229.1 putative Flp pilus-assembly TadE/G-like protein [Enterovirga rhinocerotis]